MQQKETPKPNQLDIYRRRMRFSLSQVAHLLGHKGTSVLSNYERGERLPSLENALKLGIILRVPVEFLFGALHDELRNLIRTEEERLGLPVQQALF
jgi:transcriptional regulator with XRE-family HTH domain